jgi:gliding motility-associated-like protein
MKKLHFLVLLSYNSLLFAQVAFTNFGNFKMHEDSQLGFHIDLINNGSMDLNNKGLTGFYSDTFLNVSGLNSPEFEIVEASTVEGLYLDVSIGVTHEMYFTEGIVYTPRLSENISLYFNQYSNHFLESDLSHVDGYVKTRGQDPLIFPIGDVKQLRPLIIPNQPEERIYQAAYFRENVNLDTNSFGTVFDSGSKEVLVDRIDTREFWRFIGEEETMVTLTWDSFSQISLLSSDIDQLIVVGWDPQVNKWRNLGQSDVSGNLTEGMVSSYPFNPNDFTIITIGSGLFDDIRTFNYGISPNGDDDNEFFVIEGLENYPENTLEIYNRWGHMVYSKENYTNNWNGYSNKGIIFREGEILPVGTYFYLLKINSNDVVFKGWVYINY